MKYDTTTTAHFADKSKEDLNIALSDMQMHLSNVTVLAQTTTSNKERMEATANKIHVNLLITNVKALMNKFISIP